MITIMSPTKTFREIEEGVAFELNDLKFPKETEVLIELLMGYTAEDLGKFMKVSESIAEVNYKRYKYFKEDIFKAHPAMLYFYGEAFKSLEADKFSRDSLMFAQDHLRILSGLYGVLTPLDSVKEYRLEMGSKFANPRGKDLYSYWRDKLTQYMIKQLEITTGDKILLNVASDEYSKAVDLKKVNETFKVMTMVFKELREGEYKIVGTYAKRARGRFVKYIVENRVDTIEGVKRFSEEGYLFNEELSSEAYIVFTR
ncbi:MAG: YaaA family protein [Cellulosilyticaceae bacterium]